MVTQRDVALRAGVSPRTVSNVVNGFHYVAAETRARVQQALDELDYHPNAVARTLSRGRSDLIALVLPYDVPYFVELSGHIVTAAEDRGYTVLIDRTDGNEDRERNLVLRGDRLGMFDGLIFSPRILRTSELNPASGIPVVLLGENTSPDFDWVGIDDTAAARAAVEHLVDGGRRRIATVGVSLRGTSTAVNRTNGYREAMAAAGRPVDEDLLIPVTGYQRQDGVQAMRHLLSLADPPDAVFCYNDLLALGVLRELLRQGVRIPDDIAVVGFDDIEEGHFHSPPLTSVSPDKTEIARHAVDLLVRRLTDRTAAPLHHQARWRIEARDSSKPG